MSLWLGEKIHLKKNRVLTGFFLVARVMGQLGFCSSWSFVLPRPVQPPGRLGPRSTRQIGSALITMITTSGLRATNFNINKYKIKDKDQ
jgi:hypothetical protein